jgi:hypothetical protein
MDHIAIPNMGLLKNGFSLHVWTPELGEIWAKLRDAKFISKLDLRHGFGKWDYTLIVDTRIHFHANMEHFNIAFGRWA